MMYEIERKFLVRGEFKSQASDSEHIVQGYLSTHPKRSIRVRVKGVRAFITIKGVADASGMKRMEWEKEITIDEAEQLLQLCEPGLIEKIRYQVHVGVHVFEVDEFLGENEGLVIAEVELTREDEVFEKPDWLGEEVTGLVQYYNASLLHKPFKQW